MVAAVERILAIAAADPPVVDLATKSRVIANHALWICACVTIDESPTWLIYDTPEGALTWRRVPDQVEPLHLVDAAHTAGGHADPAEVLSWLSGGSPDPWSEGGAGSGNAGVLDKLRMTIRGNGNAES